jgi:hypothetical protein
MRVFKYWNIAETTVLINDTVKSISCFGGSNHSETDALTDGHRRLEAVKRRIAGVEKTKGLDYEADIREEPLQWIGDQDVITRNRYGAEVLNSTSCIFIDIDEPVFRIWQIFSRIRSREEKKQAILEFVGRRLKKPDLNDFGVRVYETHSGIRLILEGKALDPRSKEAKNLLRSFHTDQVYSALCRKQNCYRARLTPKPYRIKMKPIRLLYPYEGKDRYRIAEWIEEYDSRSQGFSTCRLVQTIRSHVASPVVRYHDEKTKAQSSLPLA